MGSASASDEEKHSTSAISESEEATNAPRAADGSHNEQTCQDIHGKMKHAPSQRVPARPRHPSSTLVDIGFLSFHNPKASLVPTISIYPSIQGEGYTYRATMITRVVHETKMANGTKRAEAASVWLSQPRISEREGTH